MRTKTLYNLVGAGMSIFGILMMFLESTKGSNSLFFWLFIALVGAIVYGGLPDMRTFKNILKASPVTIIVSVTVTLFYIKYFGADTALKSVIGAIVAIYFIQNFAIAGFQKLLEN